MLREKNFRLMEPNPENSLKSQGDKKNYFNIGPFSRGGLEKPNPARTIDTLADGS